MFSLTKQTESAEDLTHEVFIKIWEKREALDIRAKFSAYLFRAAHNKAIDETRKIAADRRLRSELIYKYQDLTTAAATTLNELHHYDQVAQQALDSLHPQRRKVYELCRMQGKTYKEAAEELNIAPNTVKEHMSKAMASLRRFLADRGELTLLIVIASRIEHF